MKLLLGNVESLFKALPQDHRVVYWDTVRRTSYTSGIPMTCYTIRVTGLVNLFDHLTLAEVTIPCGEHNGGPADEMDINGVEKVRQYKHSRYEEIKTLANHHAVELRTGILTSDPTERLYGIVKNTEEVQS